jgi:hypothetical protein
MTCTPAYMLYKDEVADGMKMNCFADFALTCLHHHKTEPNIQIDYCRQMLCQCARKFSP